VRCIEHFADVLLVVDFLLIIMAAKGFFNEEVWNAAHAGNLKRLTALLSRCALGAAGRPPHLQQLGEAEATRAMVRAPRPSDGATPFFAACAVSERLREDENIAAHRDIEFDPVLPQGW